MLSASFSFFIICSIRSVTAVSVGSLFSSASSVVTFIAEVQGPSFSVEGLGLVKWQKWSFRLTFNHREAYVLHDVRFEGRKILDRASLVEMTVPYADPREPFQYASCVTHLACLSIGHLP